MISVQSHRCFLKTVPQQKRDESPLHATLNKKPSNIAAAPCGYIYMFFLRVCYKHLLYVLYKYTYSNILNAIINLKHNKVILKDYR